MSASTGSNIGLSYGWALGESGWNTLMDSNLLKLDRIVHLAVKDRDLSTPASLSPSAGDRYIVGASPAGDWSTATAYQIAVYTGSAWAFITPKTGWVAYIIDEAKLAAYTGSAWSTGVSL